MILLDHVIQKLRYDCVYVDRATKSLQNLVHPSNACPIDAALVDHDFAPDAV